MTVDVFTSGDGSFRGNAVCFGGSRHEDNDPNYVAVRVIGKGKIRVETNESRGDVTLACLTVDEASALTKALVRAMIAAKGASS